MKRKLWTLAVYVALCTTACGARGTQMRAAQTAPASAEAETRTAQTAPASAEAETENSQVPVSDQEKEAENHMKVMSYNIYYKEAEERSEEIRKLIAKHQPDVLMLQEASAQWVPYLQEFMEENSYSYYGYGRLGGEMSQEGLLDREQFTPILWKTDRYTMADSGHFWLSSTPEVYSSDWADGVTSNYPRCVNWVILQDQDTGGEFMAVCVHTDPESEAVRNRSSQLIVERINELRGDLPAVMAGDWNMGIADNAYTTVTEGGYPDARFRAETTTYSGTFNDWGKRDAGSFAFGDYIFTTEDMEASSFEVVDDRVDGVHISDHCPVAAEIYYK